LGTSLPLSREYTFTCMYSALSVKPRTVALKIVEACGVVPQPIWFWPASRQGRSYMARAKPLSALGSHPVTIQRPLEATPGSGESVTMYTPPLRRLQKIADGALSCATWEGNPLVFT